MGAIMLINNIQWVISLCYLSKALNILQAQIADVFQLNTSGAELMLTNKMESQFAFRTTPSSEAWTCTLSSLLMLKYFQVNYRYNILFFLLLSTLNAIFILHNF